MTYIHQFGQMSQSTLGLEKTFGCSLNVSCKLNGAFFNAMPKSNIVDIKNWLAKLMTRYSHVQSICIMRDKHINFEVDGDAPKTISK